MCVYAWVNYINIWPFISTGSTTADSANLRVKIFGEKKKF